MGSTDFAGFDQEIVLYEEVPVVEKVLRPVERIRLGTEVTRLERSGDRVVAVHTRDAATGTDERVACDQVVLTPDLPLVDELLDVARCQGRTECFLRAAPDNSAALALYRAAGFGDVDPARTSAWNQQQPADYVWLQHAFSST